MLEAYDEWFLWDSDYAEQEIPGLAPVPPDLPAGESLQQGTERVELAINGE